jgi:hypothetical protein
MKKAEDQTSDELRPEYQRSDFDALERGRYAARLAEESNVVILEPELAKEFPNDRAVNEALRELLRSRERHAV